jgi:hypothetical protein
MMALVAKKDLNEPEVESKFKNVSVKFEGSQLILPEGMSTDEGILWLKRRDEEDHREVAISEIVDAYPLEGAYADRKSVV